MYHHVIPRSPTRHARRTDPQEPRDTSRTTRKNRRGESASRRWRGRAAATAALASLSPPPHTRASPHYSPSSPSVKHPLLKLSHRRGSARARNPHALLQPPRSPSTNPYFNPNFPYSSSNPRNISSFFPSISGTHTRLFIPRGTYLTCTPLDPVFPVAAAHRLVIASVLFFL